MKIFKDKNMIHTFATTKEERNYIDNWYLWLERRIKNAPASMRKNYIKIALLSCAQDFPSLNIESTESVSDDSMQSGVLHGVIKRFVINEEDACKCKPRDRIVCPPRAENDGKIKNCAACTKPLPTRFQD